MYRDLTDIASDIVSEIKATEAFKDVTWVAVDNFTQLKDAAKLITQTPKAIVCVGNVKYDTHGLERKMSIAIVVFAEFAKKRSERSEIVWALAESASKPFLAQVTAATGVVKKEIEGVEYQIKSMQPLSVEDRSSSYIIELEAQEIAKYEE